MAGGPGDGLRLAVGLFTALRVAPVTDVTPKVARTALLLAPLATLPLGVMVALALWVGGLAGVFPWALAFVAVGLLALGSRALHLDGLADTADGLTASYDRERALAVMRTGDVGPAGAAALVLVLGVQAASLVPFAQGLVAGTVELGWFGNGSHTILASDLVDLGALDQGPLAQLGGPLLAGWLVCCSRAAVGLGCLRGIRAARQDGLGRTFAGTLSPAAVAVQWVGLAAVAALLGWVTGAGALRGLVAVLAGGLVAALVVRHCVRRLGGITGDVLGAAVELSLAAMLLVGAATF